MTHLRTRESLFAEPVTILVVDDNPQDRELISRELTRSFTRARIITVGQPAELDNALTNETFDLVVTDYRLHWSDGMKVFHAVKEACPQCPVIMFTASGNEQIAVEALKHGLADYIVKAPKHYARIPYALAAALERKWQQQVLDNALVLLRTSEARFRDLAESVPQIVYATDPDGTVRYVNDRWQRYTGRTEARMEDYRELVAPDDLHRMLKIWQESQSNSRPYEVEFRLREATTGEYRWFLTRAVPLRAENGELLGWVGTSTDIHDQKSAAENLKQADRRKDEFLATLAHELRNPLAPIRTALQFLQIKANADHDIRSAHDIIDRQLKHMIRLVDDLLEVSRITAGKIKLQLEIVSVSQVISAAMEATRPLMESAEHTLTVRRSGEPLLVNGDPTRLAQVFGNLLTNAAKYTPASGHIEVTISREEGHAVVSIKDNGRGIAPEMLGRIFELFAQVETRELPAQEGLGIGLTLARRLVELHDGTIHARSAGIGSGSEFIVQLPLAQTHADVAPEPSSLSASIAQAAKLSRRVLVVDDNRDAADSLSMLLELAQCDVRKCYEGDTALSLAEEFRPEIVLLDIGMPGRNGLEVCAELRKQPWAANIVIAALTGWGQEEDRRRTQAAGFTTHLVKPVDLDSVMQLIRQSHGQATLG